MNAAYRNAVANHGASLITHIGLVNDGVEIEGGDYARLAVTWDGAVNGKVYLAEDKTFQVPEGVTVTGWHGFSALTLGTDYGGAAFPQAESFGAAGTLDLLAAQTYIDHAEEGE